MDRDKIPWDLQAQVEDLLKPKSIVFLEGDDGGYIIRDKRMTMMIEKYLVGGEAIGVGKDTLVTYLIDVCKLGNLEVMKVMNLVNKIESEV